jgi:hypothetical protein
VGGKRQLQQTAAGHDRGGHAGFLDEMPPRLALTGRVGFVRAHGFIWIQGFFGATDEEIL